MVLSLFKISLCPDENVFVAQSLVTSVLSDTFFMLLLVTIQSLFTKISIYYRHSKILITLLFWQRNHSLHKLAIQNSFVLYPN